MSKVPSALLHALESAWQEAVAGADDKENKKCREQLVKAKQLLRDRSVKIAQLEIALSASANESERDIANAKQHVDGLTQALSNKQASIDELKAVVDVLSAENESLSAQLEQAISTNADETVAEQEELARLEEQVKLLTSEKSEQHSVFEEEKHQLNQRISALESDISAINTKNEQDQNLLKAEIEKLNQRYLSLEQERDNYQAQSTALTKQVEDLRQEKEQLDQQEADNSQAQEERSALIAELDSRGALLASLQIETRRLSEHLQRKQDENDALQRGNSMLQSRSNSISDKYDGVVEALKQNENRLNDQSKHIEILERQLRLAEQKVEHFEAKQAEKM